MKLRFALFLFLSVVISGAADAAGLEGSLTYDLLPVKTSLPDFTCGSVAAFDSSGQWTFGSVDLAAGTYAINGLTPGTWTVKVLLSTEECSGRVNPASGEFSAWATNFEISEETTMSLDLNGYYAYRVTQPRDSSEQWPGSVTGCPSGAPTPRHFTFAWEPVPRADHYDLVVSRYDCDGRIATEVVTFEENSVELELGTVSGEKFVLVALTARSADNHTLTLAPYIQFQNGSTNAVKLYLAEDDPGERLPHPTNSLFIPQVAHLGGVGSSFWTSDLILSNPTATGRVVTLVFTPRDADGLVEYETASLEIPAGGSRVLTDVLGNTLTTNGAGSLEVNPVFMEVTSRIFTTSPDGGSYGQGLPAIGPDDVVFIGGPATTLGTGGVVKGSFRSNLALVETWGESAQVTVVLLDRDGSEIGNKTVDLPPFGNQQINDVVGQLGGPLTLEEGQVAVTVNSGAGRVGAVLSVVDNASQDPTTFPLVPR